MLVALGHEAMELGVEALQTPLVTCVGELMRPQYRAVIEKMYSKNIREYYANRENTVSCCQYEDNRAFLVNAESCYVEICHRNESVARQGDMAEVVSTSLVNYAFPLIRYRVGDLAVSEGYQTIGGFTLPAVRVTGGRDKDIVLTRQGLMSAHTDFALEGTKLTAVKFYRLVQLSLDDMIIEIVRGTDYRVEEHEPQVLRLVSDSFSSPMRFAVRYIDEIPREPGGKIRAVISQLASDYLDGKTSLDGQRS